MADESVPDYVQPLLNKIADAEGFVEYKIELQPGCNHGDGLFSSIVGATIVGKKNSVPEKLQLVCKLAPANELWRQEFQAILLFKREVLIYDKILPILTEFEREQKIPETDAFYASYPKCYAAVANDEQNQYVIIMDDLKDKGYTMWPKTQIIPIDRAYRALEQLAKFHAIPFALKDQRPDKYEQLKKVEDIICTFIQTDTMKKVLFDAFETSIAVLTKPEHIDLVKELQGSIQESYEECLKPNFNDIPCAIGHGDLWTNNIMFRCGQKNQTPIEVCFFDWQMSRFCSPVIDLHLLMSTATDKEFRKHHYKNLMKHYHQSLSNAIRRLGSDPDQLFPFDSFEMQLKIFGKYAFIQGIQMMQVVLTDPKDMPKMDNFVEGVDDSKGFVDATSLEYRQRINDLVEDWMDYGYYWK